MKKTSPFVTSFPPTKSKTPSVLGGGYPRWFAGVIVGGSICLMAGCWVGPESCHPVAETMRFVQLDIQPVYEKHLYEHGEYPESVGANPEFDQMLDHLNEHGLNLSISEGQRGLLGYTIRYGGCGKIWICLYQPGKRGPAWCGHPDLLHLSRGDGIPRITLTRV